MSKIRFVGISAMVLVTVCAARARAADISATKIQIKDNDNTTKRQIQAQSKDATLLYSAADNPAANGASVHVYSTVQDLCVVINDGLEWQDTGKLWKYKNKTTGVQAQIGNGKLKVKIKGSLANYSLANGTQGTVNVQVQFGDAGTRYCLKCPGNTKDDLKMFLGKKCVASACDAEPSTCDPNTTTTTTTTTSTTTTTCPPGAPASPTIVKGALPATAGRFNYNATLGLPGANAACNTSFPGTHACSYPELQAAAAACDLPSLQDTGAASVTSFWVISANSASNPSLTECLDDIGGGSNLNWEYGTAHTASRGRSVPLNIVNGSLGAISANQQCNSMPKHWVGCCVP